MEKNRYSATISELFLKKKESKKRLASLYVVNARQEYVVIKYKKISLKFAQLI